MVPIGLLCEGPTDDAVLKRLLAGYSEGGVALTRIFPPDPMGPKDFGGWENLFAAIRERQVGEALAFNDLVIVQIDTDVCEQPGFGVSRREGDRALTERELVDRVVARLRALLTEHDPDADLGRVVFAVAVDELECWLLVHLSDRKPKTTGCFEAARHILGPKGIHLERKGSKDPRAYEAAAHELRRRKAVGALRGRAPSLDAFLADLDAKFAPRL